MSMGAGATIRGSSSTNPTCQALPHRIRHKLRRNEDFPVGFDEMTFDEWDGAMLGEHVSLDWDGNRVHRL